MMFRCLCLALGLLFPAVIVQGQISKGHQILIDRGFQIQGMVSHIDAFHLDTYTNANYSSISLFWDPAPSLLGPAPGFLWTRWAATQTNMPPGPGEEPYMSQLVTLQLGDEWDLDVEARRTELVNWFNAVRTNYPDTIVFHNTMGGFPSDANLGDYITRAQPDMLSFDAYPFRYDGASGVSSSTIYNWYSDLRRWRQFAKDYNLPLATYLQTFGATNENVRSPSPSELRLQHSMALAFNCKVLIDFTYNTGASSLFTNSYGGDNAPNALYYEKADCALRARNFGKALVRLKPVDDDPYYSDLDKRTTGMLYIRGRDANGAPNPRPIGFGDDPEDGTNYGYSDWAFSRNDPYLTGWSVTNKGTKNNGQRGDVFISWFKPLDESFDGPEYTNEVYLMVVNGLNDMTGTAADCAQEIKLNFTNSLTKIEMLNPLTGLVEVQTLTLTNGVRQLVLNLNGGDAAFFKFSDGAPFIGVPMPIITAQPANQAVFIGNTANFTARASGAPILSYQWKLNGVNIAGATTNNYSRSNIQFADAGSYTLVVTNAYGTVTSDVATLTIVSNLPPLLYEPFNYTNVGASVSSNAPSSWTYGGTGANDLNVASGNLFYPGLSFPVGNSATNGGAGLGVRRLLGTSINSGVLYFSALFRINNLGFGTWNGASTQIGALTAPDNTSFRLQVMVKSNSPTSYVIGLQKGGTGVSTTFDTTEHRTNETILLVGKYDFTTTPNPVSLWINPGSSTFAAGSPPATGFISATTGSDGLTIDRFNLRQNTAASIPAAIQWDELRFGTNWASVTPASVPLSVNAVNLLPDGRIQLEGTGDAGTFAIEASTNLVNWTEITNVTIANGTFGYTESSTDLPRRFYRLKFTP